MRVFYNQDNTNFFHFKPNEAENYKYAVDFIRHYKGTSITDFVININATLSITQSQYFETYVDKYLKTEENGYKVDYKNTLAAAYYSYFNDGLDVVDIWINELNKMGVNPWISFRMNDCHSLMEEKPNLLKPELTDKTPNLWRCGNREAIGYFDKNLNYNKPEVRERMLNYIEEQLLKYDVYGIELDFMREAFCFPDGEEDEGRVVILDFMKNVKSVVDKISAQRNREIKISVICQANPISAYNNGFDVSKFTELGLVDFVVAGARWQTINFDVPIEIWKKLIKNDVPVGAVQQLLVNSGAKGFKPKASTVDMAFGQAKAFMDKGANFVYLYNYFDRQSEDYIHSTSIGEAKNNRYILENIGKVEALNKFARRCPITYDDGRCHFDHGNACFPLTVDNFDYKKIRFVTGKIEPEQKAYLVFATEKPIDTSVLSVYTNNSKAKPCSFDKSDKNIIDGNVYTFEIDNWNSKSVVACLKSAEEFVIIYAEIFIES